MRMPWRSGIVPIPQRSAITQRVPSSQTPQPANALWPCIIPLQWKLKPTPAALPCRVSFSRRLLREKHQQHQQYQRHPNSTRTTSTPSRSRRRTVCQCASIPSQKIPHWQTIATSCAASQPQPSHREQRSAAAILCRMKEAPSRWM